MVPDALLLVGSTEGDGGDDRTSLLARVGAYVDRARAEAVERGVLLDDMDAVVVRVAVARSACSVEADGGHGRKGACMCGVGIRSVDSSVPGGGNRYVRR